MLRLYAYQGCSTCRSATKWLEIRRIPFNLLAIRETPPTEAELQSMLEARGGGWFPEFNTSGQDYRALNLKEKLPGMTPADAIALLAKSGNLVKRPFAIDRSAGVHLVGFKEAEWEAQLG